MKKQTNLKYCLLSILLFACGACFSQSPIIDWAKRIGGTGNDGSNDIAFDAAGSMYVVGTFTGTVDFDPSPSIQNLSSVGPANMFFAKYTSNGNYLWAKVITGGAGSTTQVSIAADASGNVILAGVLYTGVTYDFDPGPGVANVSVSVSPDIFVAKYTSVGAFSWVKQMGSGADLDYARSVDVDAAGNIYSTGLFGGTANFNPAGSYYLTSAGNSDIFISKLSPTGNFVWAKSIGGTSFDDANDIKVSGSNVYVTGKFAGTVDFNPGAGVYNLSSMNTSDEDAFLLKLDLSGNFIWAKDLARGYGNDEGLKIEVDASDNVYTLGSFLVDADFDPGSGVYNLLNSEGRDAFISKLTINGDFLWAKQISTAATETIFPKGLTLDASGNAYISAHFSGEVVVPLSNGTVNIPSNGSRDILFTKLNLSGDFIWERHFGGIGDDQVADLKWNASSLYAVGKFSNSMALDADNLTSEGSTDVFILKMTNPACIPTTSTISVSTCTSYTIPSGHETYTVSGIYNDTIPNAAGCDSIITINLTISDEIAPVANILSLPNVTAQCSVTLLTAPTATDNCAGTITGTHNATLPITIPGTTVVTWTYNDGNGNSSTQTQNVIINDNTAPVPTTAILVDVTDQCSVTSLTAPTATDNCAGTITGMHNATLPITTQGTTVVTWTYNDGHGNTSTQTQNVIISDNTAPVANTANLTDVTAQCSVTSLTAPTSTDNCAGTITGTHNATLPITTSGTTVVTWTYNDGHGNTSTQTQNVIINDNTAPVANTANLTDVIAQCSVTSLTVPTATDNCAGTITGTHNATLPITASGTTVVTWTYNDGHGNTSTQMQNVIINDNTAPVANAANLADVTGQCSVISLTAPTATDNCAGIITGTHNATLPITTSGTTVVTWTYDDGHGNTSTQTQNVIITLPVATTALNGITISATTSGATYQWINCGNGNTPISGATAQFFTVTANGTYAVIVTQNGCSATSACVTISTVGLQDLTKNPFTIYPNPNTGVFKIESETPIEIRITNAAGQKVLTQTLESGENTIHLPNVESGIYFISAKNESGALPVQRISVIY